MERLAEILADMIRSALAWEAEHRPPLSPTECLLTPPSDPHRLAAGNIESGGEQGGNRKTSDERKPHKDF